MGLPCVKCRRARKSQRAARGELAIKVACAYFRQKCNIKTLNKCQTTTMNKKQTQILMHLQEESCNGTYTWCVAARTRITYTSRCRCDKCDKLTWQPSSSSTDPERLVIWYEFAIYTDNFPGRPMRRFAFCVQHGVCVIMVLPTATSQEAGTR